MSSVREAFNPVPMEVNGTYEIKGTHMGGFLPKTAGTISVTSNDALGTTNVTIVDAIPVSAGIFLRMPINFPAYGGTVTLGGGASGTLLV